MKLYKEVLIESAEQAEALPGGTVAQHDAPGYARHIAVRIFREDGDPRAWRSHRGHALRTHARMVGWTALVPIEAEEETVERHRLCREVPDVLHRFTTPWTLYTAKETP